MGLVDMRTKASRVAFVIGLALMFLATCMTTAPFELLAAVGISGSLLALVSMWWTGWLDEEDW